MRHATDVAEMSLRLFLLVLNSVGDISGKKKKRGTLLLHEIRMLLQVPSDKL